MKKWLASMACVLLMAGAAGLGSGCDEEGWSPVMLNPGQTMEVDYNGDSIQFIWTPSSKVSAIRGDGRTIHFYNL